MLNALSALSPRTVRIPPTKPAVVAAFAGAAVPTMAPPLITAVATNPPTLRHLLLCCCSTS